MMCFPACKKMDCDTVRIAAVKAKMLHVRGWIGSYIFKMQDICQII